MENNQNNTFYYTYSANVQNEIRTIRKKYVREEAPEDKLATLRRLDNAATQKATVISLVVGILGALIMGTGMSLILTDIARSLGETLAVVFGVALGVLGMAMACIAYPLYNRVLQKERERIAPEIIRLTDELMQ